MEEDSDNNEYFTHKISIIDDNILSSILLYKFIIKLIRQIIKMFITKSY